MYEEPQIHATLNPELFLQFMKKMLLLQYLVTVLEGDFGPRNCAYQGRTLLGCDGLNETMLNSHVLAENMDWTILRESLLSMLLVCLPGIPKF